MITTTGEDDHSPLHQTKDNMDLKEIQELSDTDLRRRVALILGWKTGEVPERVGRYWIRPEDPGFLIDEEAVGHVMPNYPQDLNACTLFGCYCSWYPDAIAECVGAEDPCTEWYEDRGYRDRAINASARSRCEALVLAKERK